MTHDVDMDFTKKMMTAEANGGERKSACEEAIISMMWHQRDEQIEAKGFSSLSLDACMMVASLQILRLMEDYSRIQQLDQQKRLLGKIKAKEGWPWSLRRGEDRGERLLSIGEMMEAARWSMKPESDFFFPPQVKKGQSFNVSTSSSFGEREFLSKSVGPTGQPQPNQSKPEFFQVF